MNNGSSISVGLCCRLLAHHLNEHYVSISRFHITPVYIFSDHDCCECQACPNYDLFVICRWDLTIYSNSWRDFCTLTHLHLQIWQNIQSSKSNRQQLHRCHNGKRPVHIRIAGLLFKFATKWYVTGQHELIRCEGFGHSWPEVECLLCLLLYTSQTCVSHSLKWARMTP